MSDVLKHPLFLLLLGTLFSGLLIPAFTRRLQTHQKALEIKTGLVSELSKSIMGIVMSTQFVHLNARSTDQAAFDKAYRDWEIESAVIGTKLQAYLPDTGIPEEWAGLSSLITRFYALEGVDADRWDDFAAALAKDLGVPVDNEPDWGLLRGAILEQKSALIGKVLKARISVLD